MWLRSYLILLFFAFSVWGCNSSPQTDTPDQPAEPAKPAQTQIKASQDDLGVLVSWMSGSFSSQEQAEADTNYFDIRLQMMPIWQETGEHWLYVEQAVTASMNKPYRQRVYHVTLRDDGKIESAVYEISNPMRFAGNWELLNEVTPDSLILREGCEVIIHRKDAKTFVGKTGEKTCSSDLNGASYATSEVVITENQMVSWDRGFDDEGNQIWGATEGGYIFKKIDEDGNEDIEEDVEENELEEVEGDVEVEENE